MLNFIFVALGGGLALITGTQAKVPAVGLSAINSMMSRRTFDPELSIEDLNKYTFNIVPDRDVVPLLDDLALNYQRIKCRASVYKSIDCHTATRSLCEILFSCGSGNRPVPCFCVNEFGYEEPKRISGSRKFCATE